METKYLQFFDPDTRTASDSVRIGQVVKGKPVQGTMFEPRSGERASSRGPDDKFGFIAGFARNSSNELCLMIEWENGETHPVHPANLILL